MTIRKRSGFDGGRWRKFVPCLRLGRYYVTDQTVAGDAPKDFIRVYEFGSGRKANPESWPAYIAKIGHKWYPAESVTEQLMTRIGQVLGVRMAESRLMAADGQIRFLSRHFLARDESLVHGAEIVAGYLEDVQFVEDVERQRLEKEIFTFDVLLDAIRTRFANDAERIVRDFLRMLAFDTLVGNQDRHLYNWGVVVHPTGKRRPEFSPIYDTARGLFWNRPESVLSTLGTPQALQKYVHLARPLIGWQGEQDVNHFRLVACIAQKYPEFRTVFAEAGVTDRLGDVKKVLDGEFGQLLSAPRRSLIMACLKIRFDRYVEAWGGDFR